MTNKLKWNRKNKTLIYLAIVITILGFASKFYTGPYRHFFNDKLAGMFYVIFWTLLAAFFVSLKRTSLIVTVVFLVTCGLEWTQHYSNPVLEMIRSTFIGRSIIGSTFSWYDYPFYLAGAIISWLLLQRVYRKTEK